MLKEHVWPTPWPASPDIPQQENAQTNSKTEPSEVPREIPPDGIGPALQLHEVESGVRVNVGRASSCRLSARRSQHCGHLDERRSARPRLT